LIISSFILLYPQQEYPVYIAKQLGRDELLKVAINYTKKT